MGYYTAYDLSIDDVGQTSDEVLLNLVNDLDELFENGSFTNNDDESVKDRILHAYWNAYDKWYAHDDDMLALSLKYPEVLFSLDGDGEESDDLWRIFYKNGAMQTVYAQLHYDDYDPLKMKQVIVPQKGDNVIETIPMPKQICEVVNVLSQ